MRRVFKRDLESGTSDTFDHGPGVLAEEHVFVPRRVPRSEDDGWLIGPTSTTGAARAVSRSSTPGASPTGRSRAPGSTTPSPSGCTASSPRSEAGLRRRSAPNGRSLSRLARLRLGPTRHARRFLSARASRRRRTCRSLVPDRLETRFENLARLQGSTRLDMSMPLAARVTASGLAIPSKPARGRRREAAAGTMHTGFGRPSGGFDARLFGPRAVSPGERHVERAATDRGDPATLMPPSATARAGAEPVSPSERPGSRANLAVLGVATMLNRSAVPLIVLVGGLSGLVLAPDPPWPPCPSR